MALSRDIVIRLLGDADSAVKAQKAAADAAEVNVAAYRRAEREFDRQQKAMEVAAAKQKRAMQDIGTAAVGFGATMAAGLGLAVKAAVQWESSWAGVAKTVNGTEDELAALETGLRGLARVLPATHQEIAAVAEAAGQLGIATNDIVDFTRTMVNLGETTNLTADEAATSIAQLMNVMQTAPEDVDRLASTLVALGNNGASTERDIVQMAQRISGAAAIVGLAEGEVLALANTVASMGIEVEAGGTSVSRVLTDMSKAVQTGSDDLTTFANTAGVSAEEFARAFSEDPAEAFALFIDGLAGIQEEGGNVFGVLEELSLSDVRVSQALLGMASSGDLLRDSLNLQGEAWEENTALVEEAAKRYDTTQAQMEIARNNITEAGIEIGEVLLPVLADLAEGVANVAQWFADLPEPIQAALAGLGSIAAIVGVVGGGFLLLAPRVMETVRSFRDLQASGSRAATVLGNVGKAAGVAAAIAAVAAAADGLAESLGPGVANMEDTTDAMLAMGSSMEEVNALFRQGAGDLFADDINGLADAARNLTDPSLVNQFDDFTAELLSLGDAEGRNQREQLIGQIDQLGNALALMVQNGNTELAAEQFDMLAAEWERGGGSVDDLMALMPAYDEALQGVANEQALAAQTAQQQSAAAALLAEDLNVAYGSLEGYAAALGMSEDATAELIQKSNELGESLAGFVDPLGVYTSMLDEKARAEEEAARKAAEAAGASADSWRDFVTDTGFSFDEYMRRLEEQVTAQANWQQNMLILAGRVSEGTLAELARMGPEGAPLVADLVNRSDAELDRFDEITALRSQEATNAWGQQLTLAAPVLAEIGRRSGSGVVAELAAQLRAGTTTVAAIAQQYGISLAGGINPILTGLGKRPINFNQQPGRTYGGVLEYYSGGYTGPGGKYDPAGIVHAGEYVLTKEQTARLGIDRIEEFANNGYADGGFVSSANVPRPRSTAPYRPPISTPADASMEKLYNEVVAWLDANVVQGGTPGSGGALLGGGVAGLFATVKAAFPQARLNSGFRPGDPGWHGRGRAVDLGQVGRAGGNGHPYLAAMNRWIFDNFGSRSLELIYDGLGDDRADLKNGRPLTYSAGTRAAHRNHVHWAMANGGVIGEPVYGIGARSGGSYLFGEKGPETVLPGVPVGSARSTGGANFDLRGLASAIVAAIGRPTTVNMNMPASAGPEELAGALVHRLRVQDLGGKHPW